MLTLLALLTASTATARDWSCQPYTGDDFRAAMDEIDDFLRAYDGAQAKRRLAQTSKELPCMTELLRPADLSRFAVQASLLGFFEQDSDQTVRWANLAKYTRDPAPWPSDFASDHPFITTVEGSDYVLGEAEGVPLWPKKGALFLDGRPLLTLSTAVEVPHLVQETDKKGVVVDAWWQDGMAFRGSIVAKNAPAPTEPKWYAGWVAEQPEPGEPVALFDDPVAIADADPEPEVDESEGTRLERPADDGAADTSEGTTLERPDPDAVVDTEAADTSKGTTLERPEEPPPVETVMVFDYTKDLQGCPWINEDWTGEDELEVAVKGHRAVIVEGESFPVRWEEDWQDFERILRNKCSSPRAANKLRLWREGPSKAWAAMNDSDPIIWQLGEFIGWTLNSGVAKRTMVKAIKETGEKPELDTL